MEDLPNTMEDGNTEEEYLNFCSSCKSILQSSPSIGSASLELWDEKSARTRTEETIQDIQSVDEQVVKSENATSSSTEYKNNAKIVNIFNPKYKSPKGKKIFHTTDDKTKKIDANCPKIISNKSLNATVESRDNKIVIFQSSKTSEVSKSSINDNSNLSQSLSLIMLQNRILNRRKRILETSKSLLDLCDCMNIMHKVILKRKQLRKKQE